MENGVTLKVDTMGLNFDSWRKVHEKGQAAYDREFEILVAASWRAASHLLRLPEHGIHPSLPFRWRVELAESS